MTCAGSGDIDLPDDSVDAADMAHADHGDVTWATGSALLDTDSVADNEIDYANVTLADFDYQTAWRLFYSNTDGDVTELALGASGEYLKSQGASSVPTWDTPGGSGDMLKSTYDVSEDGFVDGNDVAYSADWDTDVNAPSMNAVYDKIQTVIWADGTIPLTANWDVGNFDLTFKSATGDGTIEGATITEGGVAVYNDDEMDNFSELNTIVTDKTLVNEEDGVTWDSGHTFTSTINIDDGAGDTPILYFTDGANDTVNIIKKDAGDFEIYNSEGSIELIPSGDTSDYLRVSTSASIITLETIAGGDGDLNILAAGGDIGFGNENLSTTGTFEAATITEGGVGVPNLNETDWATNAEFAHSTDWGDIETDASGNVLIDADNNVTITGDWNFGGATNFEIPNSATPTVPNLAGEIVLDTDLLTGSTGQGIAQLYSGIQNTYLVSTIDTPGNDEIPKFNSTTGTIQWEADAGAAGGDSIQIDSVDVVDPDFQSGGDIDFIDTSNVVTANLNSTVVDFAHLNNNAITGATEDSGFTSGDFLLYSDTADSGNLKKVDYDNLPSGGGDEVLIDSTAITDGSGVDLQGGTGVDIAFNAGASPDTAVFDVNLAELTGNQVWNDGATDTTFTITFDLDIGTDPVLSFSNNAMNLSTGTLYEGSVEVPNVDETDWVTNAEFAHSTDWGDIETDGSGNVLIDADNNVTITGDWNFGGATNFEIPNSSTPTVPNLDGEIVLDTDLLSGTTGQGVAQLYSGIQNTYIVATVDTPGDNEVPTYDSTAGTIQWEAAAGGGDMLKSTYDVSEDGYVDGNDVAYTSEWNGDVNAPSMNAVYGKIQTVIWADGTIPLTSNWDVGNFDLTFKAATGDGTIEGATITEGGVGVPNLNETDWVTNDEFTHSTDWGDIETDASGNVLIEDNAVDIGTIKDTDASVDEDIMTRETTTGDFEWHTIQEMLDIPFTSNGLLERTGAATYGIATADTDYQQAVTWGVGLAYSAPTASVDLTELTGNRVWNDGSTDASFTITYNLNAGTDPVLTLGNGVFNISTGALQEGGNAVPNETEVPGMTSTTPKIIFAFNIHDIDDGMDDIAVQFPRAMTISKVTAMCIGGTNVVGRLYEVDGDGDDTDAVGVETTDWTFTTTETEDTSFNNAALDAGDYLQWDTTSVSGSVTNFRLTVEGYET
jgi:hypothetical protein